MSPFRRSIGQLISSDAAVSQNLTGRPCYDMTASLKPAGENEFGHLTARGHGVVLAGIPCEKSGSKPLLMPSLAVTAKTEPCVLENESGKVRRPNLQQRRRRLSRRRNSDCRNSANERCLRALAHVQYLAVFPAVCILGPLCALDALSYEGRAVMASSLRTIWAEISRADAKPLLMSSSLEISGVKGNNRWQRAT